MVTFTKMEGLGNNYIYINNMAGQVPEKELPDLARAVSDRHFGIGSDGLICVLPPTIPGHAFRFRMFNADGSEAEMCGNGMRCFARLVYDLGLTEETRFPVQTLAGTIIPELILDEKGQVSAVRVDMGTPRLRSADIPMAGPEQEQVIDAALELEGHRFTFSAVSMGNPHIILFVDDVNAVDLPYWGPRLEHHPLFPQRTNVHFVQVIDRHHLRMRTWERGSGITMACGTGACAVLVAAVLKGLAEREAAVQLPGGTLDIRWQDDGHVMMTGPANYICRGEYMRP